MENNNKCGDNLNWTFNPVTGELIITGSGAMYDYTSSDTQPWKDYRSNITSINFPEGLTSIGQSAFYSCTVLTSVVIPSSVISIGAYAFRYCFSLTSITIPSSVTSIGNVAFYYCSSLTSIIIPSSVTSIGEYAFYGCESLTSITIPGSVKTIGNHAFQECTGLASVTIHEGVTSIGGYAFEYCRSLSSINIPKSVMSIREGAFYGCRSLTSISIPETVTSIGFGIFYGCSDMVQHILSKISNGSIRTYKGFDKNMRCLNFHYRVGLSYHEDDVELCLSGFHSCVNPIDVFNYYNNKNCQYCEVEPSGLIKREKQPNDTKIVSSDIKIIKKITLKEMIQAFNNIIKLSYTQNQASKDVAELKKYSLFEDCEDAETHLSVKCNSFLILKI